MLATRARVAALRRTGLLSRRGGGRGLWTGRPQSGTLRDAGRAAKGTPAAALPLWRRPGGSACAFPRVRWPRRLPSGPSCLPRAPRPAPRPRGGPPARRPGPGPAPARSGRGLGSPLVPQVGVISDMHTQSQFRAADCVFNGGEAALADARL